MLGALPEIWPSMGLEIPLPHFSCFLSMSETEVVSELLIAFNVLIMLYHWGWLPGCFLAVQRKLGLVLHEVFFPAEFFFFGVPPIWEMPHFVIGSLVVKGPVPLCCFSYSLIFSFYAVGYIWADFEVPSPCPLQGYPLLSIIVGL